MSDSLSPLSRRLAKHREDEMRMILWAGMSLSPENGTIVEVSLLLMLCYSTYAMNCLL